jgi:hypothetical protein
MYNLTKEEIITRNVIDRSEDFGVVQHTKTYGDRAVGGKVWVHHVRYVPTDSGCGFHTEPGEYFVLSVSPTRNGARYGSSTSSLPFKTLEEAEKKTAKYFAAARKRAVRNFGAAQ